ncbi:hypothetical protein PAXRUDRAFT_833635 [Paxillus rubicundulus Ve08.2h10]|uniref:Uncharacterized protein n=1 Tax=Paxillus rubicundulus Ve08.2h10 TaxID=930991 RepID=A0A0D0DNL7_9AGAM|nr:hypothetical protein PAXRUDRAFT_833635 [Paxillus rubicundulus Ve08.2h10]
MDELGWKTLTRAHAVLWTIGYGQPRLTKTHTRRASRPMACSRRVQMGRGGILSNGWAD